MHLPFEYWPPANLIKFNAKILDDFNDNNDDDDDDDDDEEEEEEDDDMSIDDDDLYDSDGDFFFLSIKINTNISTS